MSLKIWELSTKYNINQIWTFCTVLQCFEDFISYWNICQTVCTINAFFPNDFIVTPFNFSSQQSHRSQSAITNNINQYHWYQLFKNFIPLCNVLKILYNITTLTKLFIPLLIFFLLICWVELSLGYLILISFNFFLLSFSLLFTLIATLISTCLI